MNGSYIDESVAAVYDRIAQQYRTYPEHYLHSREARQRDHAKRSGRRYETSETETETRVVAALVTVAGRLGNEERAVIARAESRNDDDDEAARIAREHGFSAERLVALRCLARSRDVELEVVLRAALRGDLRDIVKLPPVSAVT